MHPNKKIIAVIVTHNRCELLVRCIRNIQAQSLPPDEILVINNGSTDNTSNILNELKVKNITQKNIGSAGGWNRGIDYAIKENFDAIWLMDDDGYPDKYSLKHLKNALTDEASCVSSILVKENEPESFVFPYPFINKKNRPALFSWPRKLMKKNDLIKLSINNKYPFIHLFNGALISLDSIKKIGNVNKDYFIYGDELDYLYRLNSVGEIFSIIKSIHYHPDVSQRYYSPIKIYFYLKNTLIVNKKYFKNILLRQILQVINILSIVIRRNGIIFFLKLTLFEKRRLIPLAIYRGLIGQLGYDYDYDYD